MRTRTRDNLILTGLAGLALAGWMTLGGVSCQQKSAETAAPAELEPGTTTTTTTTTTVAEVTADPVVASQRNAKIRREKRSRPTSEAPAVSAEPPESASLEVPAGTILRVAFNEPISTATAKVGDTVKGEVLDDILAEDGETVAVSSGGRVTGKIEHVVDSGKLARPAELRFRLTELETRSGMVPITTSTYENTGQTHTKRNVGYIAGGAAVGAILGQVLGKDTESTLKGAAAGAAIGTGVAAASGDLDFQIDAGRTVAFTLQEPVRVRR
jgi:hypothetical protein